MKLRKDKTNTAVYEAMMQTLKHPYVFNSLEEPEIHRPNSHPQGFYMDYMAAESLLARFFTRELYTRIPQISDEFVEKYIDRFTEEFGEKFGEELGKDFIKKFIEEFGEEFGEEEGQKAVRPLLKSLHCRGLVYKKSRNAYQCHHPLCPLCCHRRHYRTIRDLKPYLDAGRNRQHLLWQSEYVDYDQIPMAFEALEQRAKKVTRKLSPYTVQWSRQSHLRYDTVKGKFIALYVVLAISRKTAEKEVDREIEELGKQGVGSKTVSASMDRMEPLLKKVLYYDPLVLQYGGNRAFMEWEEKTPGFRYRAKTAHR